MGRPRIQGEKPITRSVKLYREWWELASELGEGNVTEGLRRGLMAEHERIEAGETMRPMTEARIRDLVEDEAISDLEGMRTVGYHQALRFAESCVKAALAQAGVK